ncbi:hypothetical protein QA601_03550 [Chitinispirillales bacterium ANBcel5]|uniref:hypothetical protein n=1 Tax=Cellulosispirillum alkaliphilum TaxID=3039283 RepID=UPI002A558DA4|nr:hypothetical protein [Chitinispirillales bacterium ANBcel5]
MIRHFSSLTLLGCVLLVLSSCETRSENETTDTNYEDGIYRGVFIDRDVIQVNVEFTLNDGIVTAAEFRHLRRDDDYHIETDQEPYRSVVSMYLESLDYLVGKPLDEHLSDLYQPENIVTTEVQGYTSATIRSSKIISAIRDGLNRGVYSY